jgi:hypothetical protein
MTYLGRRFGLSENSGGGVSCSEKGLFVDRMPLLERICDRPHSEQWRPRLVSDLNREFSERYGMPIDFAGKAGGLAAVTRALNRGDILHARIVTLHLQIPDPPALTKGAPSAREIINLSKQLRASGLLKADWDPRKHPRWPAGSPGGIGGEFAPQGDVDASSVGGQSAPIIPAEIVIPTPELTIPRLFPPELAVPRGAPRPSEITPAPLAPPDVNPFTIPRNPYPRRRKCVREWEEATDYCLELFAKGQMGRDYNRGQGRTVSECIMGRVSQDCGGNRLDA